VEKKLKNLLKNIKCGYSGNGSLGLTAININLEPTVRAKEEEEADKLVEDAQLLERLGCFALVLENPSTSSRKVAKSISIPVIGIGAGGGVDGSTCYPRYVRDE
jgi:3-methyl-2-oxobutanoate hydroxymethyltransferase